MLHVKVKSAIKTLCGVAAVIIVLYLEGKYGLITGKVENSRMSGLRILSAEFEVFGKVQGESRVLPTLTVIANIIENSQLSGVFFRKVNLKFIFEHSCCMNVDCRTLRRLLSD